MSVNYKSLSDAELSNMLSVRDNRAFEEIYNRYFGVLYSFARKLLNNDYHAEDMIQEVFVKFYERGNELNEGSNIRAYLYKSVRNMAIDQIRHQKIKIDYIASFKEYYKNGECVTDNQLRENELRMLIEKEISNLPPKMRMVFEMSRKSYLTHKQISDLTGSTPNTIKKQLSIAIMKLRAKLTCVLLLQIMSLLLWLNKTF